MIRSINKIRHPNKRRDLTYILGARCEDGVALVADRKITSNITGAVEYQDKLFVDLDFAVVGSSGTIGLFDKFRTEVTHAVKKMEEESDKPIGSHAFIQEVERISWELNKKYQARNKNFTFDVLIAIQTNKGAVLRYVGIDGLEEPVKQYQAIGSCAHKELWPEVGSWLKERS